MARKTCYILVPGIKQRPGGVDDWADRLAWRLNAIADCVAVAYEYRSSALFRWFNQGKRVNDVLEIIAENRQNFRIIGVGHSNGCDVLAKAAARPPADTIISELHLFAGAAERSFEDNGLNDALARWRVGEVHNYVSKNDGVLDKWAGLSRFAKKYTGLGYGQLGLGATDVREEFTRGDFPRVQEHREDGFGHSTWFEPGQLTNTVNLITKQYRRQRA